MPVFEMVRQMTYLPEINETRRKRRPQLNVGQYIDETGRFAPSTTKY